MKRIVLIAAALMCALVAAPTARADEIDDAVAMFTADDGLTAAEKIPALKAFIEAHKGNPKIGTLVSILGNLAEEAGDKEADKWAGEIFHKLRSASATAQGQQQADNNMGHAETGAQAATSAALPTGTTGVSPVEDEETKALLEHLNQPPPTEEEMEREMAKLPPLPPLPVPKIKIEKNAVSDKLINSATSRAAIINVREQMRLFIGYMDEEDEKKFDEKWAAALDFPCKEVNDWLMSVSPSSMSS